MTFPGRLKNLTAFAALLMLIPSCEEEIATLGRGVGDENTFFETGTAFFDVSAFNKEITAVNTNQLPLYQLGTFEDPVYGARNAGIVSEVTLIGENPVFGNLTQEEEENENFDENETIKEVLLYLPFQSSPSSDGESFELDSIFGNRDQQFTLTVSKSSFFSDKDPESSFTEAPEFYSNHDFSGTLEGIIGQQTESSVSAQEIILFEDDDPNTPEDESTQERAQLPPGILVSLDNAIFQTILDKEGQPELENEDSFNDFFQSIHIEVTATEALMFLLDLTQASITFTYTHQDQDTGEEAEEEFILGLLVNIGDVQSNAINTFEDTSFSGEIAMALDNDENAERIFVKGGSILTEIRLFDTADDGAADIEAIRADNLFINEAFLVFHVDTDAFNGAEAVEPPALYLYNADTGEPIFDADDISALSDYDGLLQDDEEGSRYRIRITDHINGIIRGDAENISLALTQTFNTAITEVRETVGNEGAPPFISMPEMAVISPLGTVLFGSDDTVDETQRLQLEIRFTKGD